jgi:uncharacterized protein
MLFKIGRIFLKTFIWTLAILIVFVLVFDRLVQFRMDDTDLAKYFHERKLEPHISYYKARGRDVRYIEVGDQPNATILFIHGAPSSLSYWKGYLSDSMLLSRASIYAVDRPGYGYSGLAKPLPDIEAQASIIELILDSLHKAHHPIILTWLMAWFWQVPPWDPGRKRYSGSPIWSKIP